MSVLATAIVNWTAMWKIFLVVLLAGTGTVVVFGFLLLGLKLANRLGPDERQGGAEGGGARFGGYVLAVACAVICVGVVVLGIYAMAEKPSSKPATPKAALATPAGSRATLTVDA
jgi:hypothetical protein